MSDAAREVLWTLGIVAGGMGIIPALIFIGFVISDHREQRRRDLRMGELSSKQYKQLVFMRVERSRRR